MSRTPAWLRISGPLQHVADAMEMVHMTLGAQDAREDDGLLLYSGLHVS